MKPLFLVIDLDGTVLGGTPVYARIPAEMGKVLDLFDEMGAGWMINSGRSVWDQRDIVARGNVQTLPKYLIGRFGCEIGLATPTGYTMDKELQKKAMEASEKRIAGHYGDIFRDIVTKFPFYTAFCQGWDTAIKVRRDVPGFEDYVKELEKDPEVFVVCHGDETHHDIRIFPYNPSKGTGLSLVMKELGLSPDQVIVAGDDGPDILMMDEAHCSHCICPANAIADVKEHVQARGGVVAEAENAEGVLEGLRELAQRHGWDWLK